MGRPNFSDEFKREAVAGCAKGRIFSPCPPPADYMFSPPLPDATSRLD